MNDFITLTCPSCGGKLEITEDIQQFACAHCGTEHRVNRSTSIVTLSPLVASIKKVQTGVDKTASELAIKRLKDEIATLEKEYTENYGTRSGLITRMINWAIVSFVGSFALIIGIQSGEIVTLFIGFIIAGFGVFQIYKTIQKYLALGKKLDSLLAKARKKNKEMKKHQANVSQ